MGLAHDSTDLEAAQSVKTPEPPSPSFERLYTEYAAFTWRALRHLGLPPVAIDDAVQELWVVVYRRQEAFEGRSDFKSWLFGIAINMARNERRGQRRRDNAHTLQSADLRTSTDPHESERQREAFELVQSYLATLDQQRREVFVSCLLEGMTAAETARATGLGIEAVQNRVRALRRSFKAWLVEHGSAQ